MAGVLGEHFESLMPHIEAGFSPFIFTVGTLVALAGIGLASLIWLVPVIKIEKLNVTPFRQIAHIVENKYFFDEIYQATIIRLLMVVAAGSYLFDRWVIDYCIVNGVGVLTRVAADAWGWFDRTIVDGLVNLVGWITKALGTLSRQFQTGVTQHYIFLTTAAIIVISVAVMALHRSSELWIPIRMWREFLHI